MTLALPMAPWCLAARLGDPGGDAEMDDRSGLQALSVALRTLLNFSERLADGFLLLGCDLMRLQEREGTTAKRGERTLTLLLLAPDLGRWSCLTRFMSSKEAYMSQRCGVSTRCGVLTPSDLSLWPSMSSMLPTSLAPKRYVEEEQYDGMATPVLPLFPREFNSSSSAPPSGLSPSSPSSCSILSSVKSPCLARACTRFWNLMAPCLLRSTMSCSSTSQPSETLGGWSICPTLPRSFRECEAQEPSSSKLVIQFPWRAAGLQSSMFSKSATESRSERVWETQGPPVSSSVVGRIEVNPVVALLHSSLLRLARNMPPSSTLSTTWCICEGIIDSTAPTQSACATRTKFRLVVTLLCK
mmetsp:Transcript_29491/g.80973  ORF Transcript_29491/g.80973 Transcript_29491/m.80973 type:complete len:356 (-) Transcript_29491:708-1775(-)